MSDISKLKQPKTLSELKGIRDREAQAESESREAMSAQEASESADVGVVADQSFSDLPVSTQSELLDAGFKNSSEMEVVGSESAIDWGFGVFLIAMVGLFWLMKRL